MSESTTEKTIDEVSPEPTPSVEQRTVTRKKNKTLPTLGVAIGVLVAVGAVLQLTGTVDFAGLVATNEAEKVVATVNSTRITRGQLDTRLKELQGPNVDPTAPVDAAQERMVLEQLVDFTLLMDVAAASNFTATDEEVTKEIDTLVTTFGSQEKLDEQLIVAGITQERLRENLKDEIVLRKVIEANTDTENITISDEEVKKIYDEKVAGTEGAPSYEELVPFIRDQLKQEQVAAQAQEYLSKLRSSAEIEILI